jgi:hypothetical protein
MEEKLNKISETLARALEIKEFYDMAVKHGFCSPKDKK